MPLPTTSITLDPRTAEHLRRRETRAVSRSEVIRRIVDRYADVCSQCKPDLSESEWTLVHTACRSWLLKAGEGRAASVHYLPFEVETGIEVERLDEKLGVDGKALVGKLLNLDYAGRLAVLDAIEVWCAGLPPE